MRGPRRILESSRKVISELNEEVEKKLNKLETNAGNLISNIKQFQEGIMEKDEEVIDYIQQNVFCNFNKGDPFTDPT